MAISLKQTTKKSNPTKSTPSPSSIAEKKEDDLLKESPLRPWQSYDVTNDQIRTLSAREAYIKSSQVEFFNHETQEKGEIFASGDHRLISFGEKKRKGLISLIFFFLNLR